MSLLTCCCDSQIWSSRPPGAQRPASNDPSAGRLVSFPTGKRRLSSLSRIVVEWSNCVDCCSSVGSRLARCRFELDSHGLPGARCIQPPSRSNSDSTTLDSFRMGATATHATNRGLAGCIALVLGLTTDVRHSTVPSPVEGIDLP